MPGWKDRYVQGSFRGVKFFSERSTKTVGQRRAVYDLPFDDKGAAFRDLGRKSRRFRITAILLGDDYDVTAEKLIKAIEDPEEGELVHPWGGVYSVIVDSDIDIEESVEMGGMCVVSFSCVEGRGAQKLPSPVDSTTNIAKKVTTVRTAAKAAAVKSLLQQVKDFIKSANISTLDNIVKEMRELNGTIGAALNIPSQLDQQINALAKQTKQLIDTPAELFDKFDDTISGIIASVNLVAGVNGNSIATTEDVAVAALTQNVTSGSSEAAILSSIKVSNSALRTALSQGTALGQTDPEPEQPRVAVDELLYSKKTTGKKRIQRLAPDAARTKSSDSEKERQNNAVLKTIMRASALAAIAEAIVGHTFDSTSSAREIRDEFNKQALLLVQKPIATTEIDDQLGTAIMDLRSAVSAAINSLELTDVTEYQHGAVASSFEIAYELYGDATRFDEIEARNELRHPGFIVTALTVATK